MISIIGVGLIGGSLAKDLRQLFPEKIIMGIDASTDNLYTAKDLKLIDQAGSLEDVKNAEWVILAVPVHVILNLLPEVLSQIGENTLVFDMGSTKFDICQSVANHPKRSQFLACHPIAGTEFSGPQAAQSDLFKNKTNIICDAEKTNQNLLKKAVDLFELLGMTIRYMDSKSHDTHIAYVSHLSHISSFMLGKTVIEQEKNHQDIFDMAGSGFASTVRLAKSSPEMWLPIFKQNKTQVLSALEDYIKCLNNFKHLLEKDDDEGLYLEMKNTNRIKDILP